LNHWFMCKFEMIQGKKIEIFLSAALSCNIRFSFISIMCTLWFCILVILLFDMGRCGLERVVKACCRAGSWWILNWFCVGRWFIHQFNNICHSLCWLWGSKGSFSLLSLLQGVDGTWVVSVLTDCSITALKTFS